ncbi:hypothetical protein VHEMI02410 [[Torrubiella] hemipterigena]|uniref:Alpha/beta hydrolase fold-3 domain-containing protein n=1 Tax=[Torrubiella] hemipterigena TaxID=1531966 RepID=A0A0A1TAD7_9HYPO|nr:hypothetical protein VHEMI02410 [[Torrubiella] hemipterigena]
MTSIANHRSANAALAQEDPEWAAFYAKHSAAVPVLEGTAAEMRARSAALKAKAKAAGTGVPVIEGVTVKDVQVPTTDGAEITVRVYTPIDGTGPRPGLLFMHGGGWTLGDLDGEDSACRSVCVGANVVVVSVDYRLAPEHPFPTGLNDSWNSFLWMREYAGELGINKDALSIGGSSAGANFTAVLAHRARDHGIKLLGQLLRIPCVCHLDAYPPELNLYSMEDLKDAPLLSRRSVELFLQYYAADPTNTDMSPLLNKNFAGLAPAYIQIAGADPLRDEGLAYADKLKHAGVTTKVDIYPGLPHAFGFFTNLSATVKYAADLVDAMKSINSGTLHY